ncbi:PREDICTED: collagen alpha-2(I) chain-like isoform X10 [Poecilia mexicana]|uniref:collagen alpha-2(I) chain-like isoform X10 n=1 Tax=Poecilia mexicana TaxID=48701 RepID=UPI00072D955A|nr:PREDICTED: collagen alpha-2(I) chain-like isoform X10 [Poecilia mexicana]
MLPPNLLIVSIVILLATTASTAPVEEKEVEEVETEATEMLEGELSEEEEGAQQTTVSAAAAGGSAISSNIQHMSGHGGDLSSVDLAAAGHPSSSSGSAVSPGSEGSTGSAASIGSAGSAGFVDSAGSAGSPGSVGSMGFAGSVDSAGSVDLGGSPGSVGSAAILDSGGSPGSVAAEISGVSAGQTHPAGSEHLPSPSKTDMNGPGGIDSENNGNGQKLLNGGGGGAGVSSQTGIVDPSSHDFLLNLMGGGLVDPFSTDGLLNIPAHLTAPPHHDFSGTGVTAAPPGGQNIPGSPAGNSSYLAVGRVDQSGAGGTSLTSGSDQSLARPFPGSSHSAVSSTSLIDNGNGDHQQQTNGEESPDNNGNGRQNVLTDINGGVTERMVSLHDNTQSLQMQTDLTGGTESVTHLHVDLNSGLGRDVTELSPITLSIEPAAAVTNTLSPVSGVYSNTGQVTATADSTGTDTVTALPKGTPFDSSHPAGTGHSQMAGWACPLQVQSLNSTTHLVRVLKVLKMWNWRIPADFHMKPRVRFIRFQIPCTDQSAWPRNSDSTH